jgi:hypothetical protein
MTDTAIPAPPEPTIPVRWLTPDGATLQQLVTEAQLHGEACMLCHSQRPGLEDAGHVYGEVGGGWRAKACPAGECEVTV